MHSELRVTQGNVSEIILTITTLNVVSDGIANELAKKA